MKSKEEKLSTDAPMTATDEAGLACLLTDADIRKRKAAIRAEFKLGVKAVKELPDGYELQFPGDPNGSECCRRLSNTRDSVAPF